LISEAELLANRLAEEKEFRASNQQDRGNPAGF